MRKYLFTLIMISLFFTSCNQAPTGEYIEWRGSNETANELTFKGMYHYLNFETEMARLERFEKKLRVITALENSPKSVEKNWGVGGPFGLTTNSFNTAMGRGAAGMIERLSNGLDNLDKQVRIQSISFQELDNFFKNQKSLLSSTPSIWPTRGWVTSGFGFRKSPFTGLREKHEGWDIAARSGSPVRATADGEVVVEGREYGYGNMIEISHGYGVVTRYGHNSKHRVKVGDRVKRGQVISLVGNTGRSTGPHLHYEVLINGKRVSANLAKFHLAIPG